MQTSRGIGAFNENSVVNSDDGIVLELDINNDRVFDNVEGDMQNLASKNSVGASILRPNGGGSSSSKRGGCCGDLKQTHNCSLNEWHSWFLSMEDL